MTDPAQSDAPQMQDTVPLAPAWRRLPEWFKGTLILFVCMPVSILLFMYAIVIWLAFLAALIITLFYGLKCHLDIKRSCGRLHDNGYVKPAILLPLLLIPALSLPLLSIIQFFNMEDLKSWEWKIKLVGKDLHNYASTHEGRFPPADSWCDTLYQENPNSVLLKYREFVLNDQAAPLGSDTPADMVLLFKSKNSWNLCGGPELIDVDSCNASDEIGHFLSFCYSYLERKCSWRIVESFQQSKRLRSYDNTC